MSTVTFPWQHNERQSKIGVFFLREVLFDLFVHSVGVSENGHYTAQAEESVLNSGVLNKAFFILGR